MKKMSKFTLILLVLVLSTVLYGCNDSMKNETTSQSDTKNPKNGGTVTVGIQQDLDSLDPYKATGAGTKEVLFNIFEGLVKPDENGTLVPAVASKYSVSDDGKTYTFTLRDGVKFHNGKEVTAEDVKYSIERGAGLLDKSEPLISTFKEIEKVIIKDEKTVDIVLNVSDTEFIAYLTAAIIPKDYKDTETKPIGTGPFKFVSYNPGDRMITAKNEDYWQKGLPYLDKVDYKIIANADSVLAELKAGSVDIYTYLTDDQAKELKDSLNVLEGSGNIVQGLYLNNKVKPFDNAKVRKAMNMAIDRQEVSDMVLGGKGYVLNTALYPGLAKYYNKDTENTYTKNIDEAKKLLEEAGYKDGFTFTVKVPSNYQAHIDSMQVIAEQLKAVNITANIEKIEWASWLEDVYTNRKYEATIIAIDSTLAPKDMMLRYETTYAKNFTNYSNAEYDKTIKEAVETTDDAKKVELYKKCQQILTDDAASVFIQDPMKLVAVNKKLAGFKFYPVYVTDMASIYFTE